MSVLGFGDQNQQRSGFRAREVSPDSVIFSVESNFSLFSSASASVERCSFASDVHDHESLVSELSQHLAGHSPLEISRGPDSDPKRSTGRRNRSHNSSKIEKAKVRKEENDSEDTTENLDSARNCFSQALKGLDSECQEQRSRSEKIKRKSDRRRPASIDLNYHMPNATNSSPRFGGMKKSSALTRQNVMFPSPGTPNYGRTSVRIQKGWSSERVPLHGIANRKHVSCALLPYNNYGRTLPSKWEDAERWIFSPVSGDGHVRPSFQQPQMRPKSKSGPLGPPGIDCYPLYSPALHIFEGGSVGNLMTVSPFSACLMAADDSLSIRSGVGNGGAGIYPARMEPCMERSVTIHGCSELLGQSSLAAPQDARLDDVKGAANDISRAVSRRDMATQMSPEGSPNSSPRCRLSFSLSSPSVLPIMELESVQSSKLEVRDVQVDERVTMTRWSKKHRARFSGKSSESVERKKKDAETRSSAWEVPEASKSISQMKRDQAKIIAWENLQKAKAEAAIRKLEMKLEKKRSSSMDRIMSKLRSAQKKAQDMRSSVLSTKSHQVTKTSHRVISFRQSYQISSLSGCFTCHAF